MDKLYIVIPAYNEEENIETVVAQWHEVIVNIGPESVALPTELMAHKSYVL